MTKELAPARARSVRAIVLTTLCAIALDVAADSAADLQAGIEAYERGDLMTSMTLYRSAAEAGQPEAQARLAWLLDQAEQNEEAAQWYRSSAEQGYPPGEYGLAEMFAKGDGVEKDFDKAVEYFMRAAASQHTPAMRVLATAYAEGALGREPDMAESQRWLTLAAEAGDRNSMQLLVDYLSESGADAERAAYWEARLERAQSLAE